MAFQIGENVLLKVSPIKGMMIFGKKGKLSPRYIGPLEILDCVGPIAYTLALSPNLSRAHLIMLPHRDYARNANAHDVNTIPPVPDNEGTNAEFRNVIIQLLAKSVANQNNRQVPVPTNTNGG
ncbi:uncharacterized protein LOC125824850 [Solanum verrucosum]|uniref:uncharacterized protein LOC125824850 n=1 Tax=Solanum verrucosum TaxID=315347 RepID=UPI0020D0D35C|nr:uncharacterized protein LOC125824850 [Solanum verrucosum]